MKLEVSKPFPTEQIGKSLGSQLNTNLPSYFFLYTKDKGTLILIHRDWYGEKGALLCVYKPWVSYYETCFVMSA